MPDQETAEPSLGVLVADDHPIFLAGMRQLLDAYPGLTCVGAVTSGVEAVRLAVQRRPDVAVLDLDMPDLSGVEVVRAIGEQAPGIGVLMLTMLGDDESVFAALRAGARGYLLKGATPDEVVAAIRSVASGGAVFGPSIAARIVEYFAARPAAAAPALALPELTEREREILAHLADGESNAAIAARLYLSPKTVRNHLSNIFTKLHVADRHAAARRAREAGLGRP
ncbi:DNA-binding NarL/FixJ family response regulator [Allocatelliglobosispora scoriae]|uniref:DNA-binding NarL/FixJ family response regulator n=1 Tax=Allocatelliglobosispora scoriae TaxID=643052 RepID=A0A841C5E3_9ACTN|nr:response regulator transcription factor [Allocatelliglobosispora scoriae]MBB5874292.1 DNA-binding NarL/FixJ family response regulator [Allocatelliglobosispora scoriae]